MKKVEEKIMPREPRKTDKRRLRNKVRKYIVMVLFAVLFSASTWSLAAEMRKYMYAGWDWQTIPVKAQNEISLPKDTVLSEIMGRSGYESFVQRYVGILSAQQAEYPFLNWEKLHEVQIKHCNVLDYLDYSNKRAQAIYNPEKNLIIIWENSASENVEINLLLIREALLDCLTYNPECNDILRYGIKVVLSAPYEKSGISLDHPEECKEMYKIGQWEFEFLNKFLDKKDIIFLWFRGHLESLINDYTEGKYYCKLQASLQNVALGEDEEKYTKVAQDILVHFAKEYVERKELPKVTLEEVKELLLLKEYYFLDLLS